MPLVFYLQIKKLLQYFIKLLKIVYSIYALITFIIIMMVALPFILIAAMFGIKGGNFIYKVCRIWSLIWYATVGIYHKEIYNAPHNKNKQYIFVANHISYIDIPPIVLAIHQPVRVLGKSEMTKIPIFGWIYKATAIQVNRSNAENRAKSVRALKAALARGLSIVVFPEGTFNMTPNILKEFYDGAFRIAIETQTNIKPLLLINTLERLHYKSVFSLTPGINSVVYLQEISVQGLTNADLPQLKQQVYTAMENGLKQYRAYV
jgi:1-acyl-sn-glycerol-3-phosphate acyltransferase